MNARDAWTDLEVLSRFAAEFGEGGSFEPARSEAKLTADRLPGRVPGEAARTQARESENRAAGPSSVILDCARSRTAGYTHVLWIAPTAEAVLGSAGFERLGEIVGRVYGVTSFQWEGIDRLHVAAGDISWSDLLTESRDALAVYMAGRH